MFAAGAPCKRMTTPYAAAPPETPARGAIVAEDSRFSITSQFCGRAILRPPRSAIWKFGLGCTAEIETAGMLAAPAGAAAVAGASGNTAPFFLFSAVHRPLFAPAAISFASYACTAVACFRTSANWALSLEYCLLGQSLICP